MIVQTTPEGLLAGARISIINPACWREPEDAQSVEETLKKHPDIDPGI